MRNLLDGQAPPIESRQVRLKVQIYTQILRIDHIFSLFISNSAPHMGYEAKKKEREQHTLAPI